MSFLLHSTPPRVEHQFNALETIGNTCLAPLSSAVSTFYIKMKAGESLLYDKIYAVALMIITIPLTLIGIVLKGIGQIWPHKKIHATDENEKIRLTSLQRVKECYDQVDLMQKVFIDNGFQQNGIPQFMMIKDTALGAERHGGMIPWIDTIDIVIFNEKNFLDLKDKFLEAGLQLNKGLIFSGYYTFEFTKEKFKELYPDADSSKQAINVFVWSKMADGSYAYDSLAARTNWKADDYITAEEMQQGLEMKPFGHLQLPGLKSQISYLKRTYGEHCLTHGIANQGHAKISHIVCPFARFGEHHFFEIRKYKACASTIA